MIIRKTIWTKSIAFTGLMVLVGIAVYLFLSSDLSDRLWLKHVYGDIHPLDSQGRCLVVELNKKQPEGKKCELKIYDTKKKEFVHLDLCRSIREVKEIRPGYYALYDRLGFQTYTIVMPYVNENDYYSSHDEIKVIDCIPEEWYRLDDDSTTIKLSRNIREAENQLLKLYHEKGSCGYELVEYATGNTSSLVYGFAKLKEESDVSILTSQDRKVRFYTWDTHTGGTSPDYAAYVQYNNGPSINIGRFTPFTSSKYVDVSDVKQDGYEPSEGGWIDCLYQIDQPNGNTVYITSAYNKASSSEGGQDIIAMQIIDGKLQKIPFTYGNGEESLSTGCYYSIPDWYFTTDGLGWDWVPSFDSETNTLYVPEDGDMVMSDRYNKYQFKDGKMRYVGNGAGFWLHPSLHNFKRLCGIYQTKTKFIRVDLLADGNYRYAAWNKRDAMSGTPELVIIGGKTDEIDNAIVFEKDDYQYIVPAYRRGQGDDFGKFIIKKNGKVIQEAKV